MFDVFGALVDWRACLFELLEAAGVGGTGEVVQVDAFGFVKLERSGDGINNAAAAVRFLGQAGLAEEGELARKCRVPPPSWPL